MWLFVNHFIIFSKLLFLLFISASIVNYSLTVSFIHCGLAHLAESNSSLQTTLTRSGTSQATPFPFIRNCTSTIFRTLFSLPLLSTLVTTRSLVSSAHCLHGRCTSCLKSIPSASNTYREASLHCKGCSILEGMVIFLDSQSSLTLNYTNSTKYARLCWAASKRWTQHNITSTDIAHLWFSVLCVSHECALS